MGTVAALSDVGRRHRKNEDAILSEALPGRAHLLVVADGVGGERAGEIASRGVIDVMRKELGGRETGEPEAALRRAIAAANAEVWQRSQDDPSLRGMASTVVAAIVSDGQARIANVGDSRAYLIQSPTEHRQLTDDHSLVAQRVRDGSLSEEDARVSRARHIITRSIGSDETVEVDTFGPIELPPESRLLLCSDGLHDVVPDEEIATIVATQPPAEAARQLVAAANARGGPDNISVVIFHQTDVDEFTAAATDRAKSRSRRRGAALGVVAAALLVALGAVALATSAIDGGSGNRSAVTVFTNTNRPPTQAAIAAPATPTPASPNAAVTPPPIPTAGSASASTDPSVLATCTATTATPASTMPAMLTPTPTPGC